MASRILQLIRRTFRIGKERYFVGQDLVGNSYYEKQLMGAEHSRPKRFVNFKYHRNDPALYRTHHLPPQWSAWLAFTRQHPPSIEELQADQLRLTRLQENVRRLELEDKARKQIELEKKVIDQTNTSTLPDFSESVHPIDDPQELERKRRKINQSPLSAFTLQTQVNPDENWQPESWNPQQALKVDKPSEKSKQLIN